MILHENFQQFIDETLPELSEKCKAGNCTNTYDFVEIMQEHVSEVIHCHDLAEARKCLDAALMLYNEGDQAIKNALENVFVYSFSHSIFHDDAVRDEMVQILPEPLYELYKRQVIGSHI